MTSSLTADIAIIGASHAGGEAASRIRQGGFTGSIALIGAEPHLPYQRPPLSKAFLAGDVSTEDLLIRAPETYAKANITCHLATTVQKLIPSSHQLNLSSGVNLTYGKLILATGGRPRRVNLPGSELQGLYYIRTIADVEALRPAFTPGSRLVIVGGGYIGLEVAAVAIKHGLDVEIVEFAPRLLARVAGPELSAFYEAAHRNAGVKIRLGLGVAGFEPAPNTTRVGAVRCADGTLLPADLVLIAVGLIPNTELAMDAGLAIGNGIVVDEFCQTSDPDILAIGDCTEHPLPFLGGQRVRLESVPNAMEQARVVASVLNGKPAPYSLIPWFWSDQYHLKLQSAGLSQGHDEVILRPPRNPEGFVAFYLKEKRIIAADCVNALVEFNTAKRLITARTLVDSTALADPATDLKSLL
jgi:3-phenylpropionate/trans-cinnamate dioxygenase ferredoxin reductase subunit